MRVESLGSVELKSEHEIASMRTFVETFNVIVVSFMLIISASSKPY